MTAVMLAPPSAGVKAPRWRPPMPRVREARPPWAILPPQHRREEERLEPLTPVPKASDEPTRLEPAIALRKTFRDGYGAAALRADLAAGLVVGIVALPLSMALAIASGVPPQHGLYTAIVVGAAIALVGGSRVQVSGPTAAFVVLLAPISAPSPTR